MVLPMVSPNVERGHTPAICHFRLCLMSNSALSYVQHGRSLVDAVGGIDSLTLESRSLSDCYTSVPSARATASSRDSELYSRYSYGRAESRNRRTASTPVIRTGHSSQNSTTPVKISEHTSRNSTATEDNTSGITPEAEKIHPAIAMNNSRSGQQILLVRRAECR